MTDIIFTIPTDKAELLSEISSNYSVKNVVIPGEILGKLEEARTLLRDEGANFIIDNFDTYYSVLHHADTLRSDVVFKAFKDLHKAVLQLDNTLGFLLDDKDNLNDEIRAKTVIVLKMLLYIYIQFVLYLEQKRRKNHDEIANKSKKNKKDDDFVVDRSVTMSLLNNIIQRDINLFWEPPVVEHDFVGMLAELCHSILQNPAIKHQKEDRNAIFDVFGNLVKSYDYGKTFVMRIIQSIRNYEHVVHCVPEGVKLVVETFKCKALVHQFVKEATEWQVNETFQDNQGIKWCSLFLTEMAILMPRLMIPEVMYLNQYLSHDSPPLRISILNIITEVILKVLTKHDLTDEEKESRDEFLDVLVEHFRDVTALVRAKAIQNIARLQKENAIPLNFQNEIIENVTQHLYDKGVAVRKAAISCVTTFLQHNPFGANLQLKKTEEELARKKEILKQMEASYIEAKTAKITEMEGEWEKIAKEVKTVIVEKLEEGSDEEEDEENKENEDTNQNGDININKDEVATTVREFLKTQKYAEAFKECRKLKNSIEEWKNMKKLSNQGEIDLYLAILRSLFINAGKLTDELRTGAGMTAEDIQKIETTENLVKYLENSASFLRVIDSAMETMKKLLFTTSISDMHEAINFFVTAFQFQIDNANQGVIEMLRLIQYNEPERKEGVLEAFRTIYLTTDTRNMIEHTATISNRLISIMKEITYDHLDDFQNIISEWTSKGILDNSVIDRLWQYYTQREPVSNEDARIAGDLLRMAAKGRRTIITKNVHVVTTVAFSDKFKNDMLFLGSSCRLLAVIGSEKIDIQSKDPPFRIKHADPIFQNLVEILVGNFFRDVPYYSDALQAGIECIFRVCSKPNEVCEKIVQLIYEKMNESKKTVLLNVRFCEMLGHLAINCLGFLDNTVYRELKRRNFVRESRKENKNTNRRKSKSRQSIANKSSMNESVLRGAEAEDTDAEFILNVLENYVVTNLGALGNHVNYLKQICERPDIYKNLALQQAAVIALMRYMLVSSKFCGENIRLLFTIFEKTTYSDVKCTILIHCSDLLTRFPNIVEPWSPRIYEKLKDPLVKVRKTAFFALSNLILRDMIRAHSHMSEMAACLMDGNAEISTMAKTFFRRLAQKENNLANVIPDIFSHLVKTDDINEENLRFIMKFLFDLVDNSKRTENIVDRFCCKYTPTEELKLNRNITYCLSLINYNEKALKKLHEKFPLYKHHVHDAEIYSLFKQILAEASKQKPGKANLKPIATDIEKCIASVFEIGEDGQPAKTPPPLLKKPARKRRQIPNKRIPSRKQTTDSDSEEEIISKNKKTRKGSSKRNRRSATTSESE